MVHSLRRFLRPALLLTALAGGLLAVACTGGDVTPKWDARSVGGSIKDVPFTPVIVNSNVGRGPTRLAFALLKQDQTLILDGDVSVKLFRLSQDPEAHPDQAAAVGDFKLTGRVIDIADHEQGHSMRLDRDEQGRTLVNVAISDPARPAPVAPAHDGAMSAIYTTMVDFKESGRHGAQLTVKTGNRTYRNLLVTFVVLDRTAEPSVGDAAPRTKQKIAKDVADLSEIDSSARPNPQLHDITVADAIASGRPSVVAFVTPAFCQTRFCGPVVKNVVLPLSQEYAGRVHVMHIEPYDLPTARKGQLVAVDAAQEWNLRAEPFIAVLDSQGRVTAKFEGIIDHAEVKDAVEAALAAR